MHHIHILWHHTTLFMTSHALYLWHHSHYMWNCIHPICVITTTLLMISDQLYVWHHTHFMYDILCTVHNVTSTLFDFTLFIPLHPLHLDITMYTSDTWQNKCYICNLTHYIWHYFHCICVIKPRVSIIPHPLSEQHHTHYMYNIIFSMHGITWTL